MKDHKQEAIDKIERFLFAAWEAGGVDGGGGYSQHCSHVEAKILYDSIIAPLIRGEFPEEEFRRVALRYRDTRDRWIDDRTTPFEYLFDQMIADYKRLWEGQEPREGDNILEQDEPIRTDKGREGEDRRQPKGTCQTCGGSGHEPPTYDCPDCEGTGEGQAYPLTRSFKAVHKRYPFAKLRRSGEERREKRAPLGILCDDGPRVIYLEDKDGRWYFEQRGSGDRRASQP